MTSNSTYTPEYRGPSIPCIVCGESLTMRMIQGRKSGKPFVMLMCGKDGRHFRAFINDREYVRQVIHKIEGTE